MKLLMPINRPGWSSWFGRMGSFDPVVHQLGQTLRYSLEHPHHTSKIFLDHVLRALNCHFVCSYGGVAISAPRSRGGLSPWQMRRATELLEAHLGGNIVLQQVAEACELSVSHFARAFKTNLSQTASSLVSGTPCGQGQRSHDEFSPAPCRHCRPVWICRSIWAQPLLQANTRASSGDMATEDNQRATQCKGWRRYYIPEIALMIRVVTTKPAFVRS